MTRHLCLRFPLASNTLDMGCGGLFDAEPVDGKVACPHCDAAIDAEESAVTDHGEFSTYTVSTGAMINVLEELPPERKIAALVRFRDKIAAGAPLQLLDDDTFGSKSTECSWGVCNEHPLDWPAAQDHVWPLAFIMRGRVAPLKHGHCPLDWRTPEQLEVDHNGCFYTCRAFNPRKSDEPLTRESVIQLYNEKIEKLS